MRTFLRRLIPATLASIGLLGLGACDEPTGSAPVEEVAWQDAQSDAASDWTSNEIDTDTRDYLSLAESEEAARLGLLPEKTRSVLKIDRTMRHGQFEWQDSDIPEGRVEVRVDLKRQLVSAFRGGHEIGTAVILYGADGNETPTGRFPIKRKSEDYRSRTYNNAPMPYSLWLTDDGVALHGSKVEWGRATHGCVGVPVGFAEKLFEVADSGDVVQIVDDAGDAPVPDGQV
ncbi:L,D-transpeptidase family protein [Parapontixanthobacter aurantiacus]|nr:L,D-transpeptidase family protein [Parapontixanthobacter aurantiacus]